MIQKARFIPGDESDLCLKVHISNPRLFFNELLPLGIFFFFCQS